MKQKHKEAWFDQIYDQFYELQTAYEATPEQLKQLADPLLEKITEFCTKLNKTNLLVTEPGLSSPLWLVALIATELAYTHLSLQPLKQKVIQALDELKQIEKPQYKRYRGGITAFSIPLHYGCPVVPLVLIEDGLDPTLEKVPPLVTATGMFGVESINEKQKVLLAKLLDLGLDPNEGDPTNIFYPLINACDQSLVECAEMLLTAGADVNIQNKYAATPIMYAITEALSSPQMAYGRFNRVPLVELLLKNGASIDGRTTQNRSFMSMVKKNCTAEEKEKIYALVKQYKGEEYLQDKSKPIKRKQYDQYLNQEQINSGGPHHFRKHECIEWIIAQFKENGVTSFEAGHITKAYNALKIDRFNEGIISKCPPKEAEKNLKKMIKKCVVTKETDSESYIIV